MLQQDGAGVRGAANKTKINVSRSDVASVRIVDTDLVLTMRDGRKVYVRDGAVQSMIDQGFAVEFADGVTVSGQELLQSAGTADVGRIAVTGSGDAAADVLTQAPVAESVTAPAAAPASSGGIKTWLLIGAPLVGGLMAGVLGGGGKSTTSTDPGTGTAPAASKPGIPVITVVSGDDKVSAAEKSEGITIRGTSEAGLAVSVIWGTTTKTATADASGLWNVTFASGEVPGDAVGTTVSATVKSAAGVSSDPGVRTVLVDTTPPTAPVITIVSGDDIIGPSEAVLGVLVTGRAEAGTIVSLNFGAITRSLLVDAVGNWSTSFAPTEIPAAGSYTVSASATDALGNVGAVGSRTVTVSPAVTLQGVITLGPAVTGNGLTVNIFKGDGTQIASNVRVNADGSYVATGLTLGVSDIVIARVSDGSPGADYLDEATGEAKDLTAQLLAIRVVTGGNLVLNVNPLTTIAAQKAGLSADGSGVVTSATVVGNANSAVATALGLAGIDLVTTAPAPTNGGGYNPADGFTAGEKIGAVLATFSGLDAVNSGDAQKSIDQIVQTLTTDGATGTLADAGQQLLMEGAAVADANVEGSLQQAVSDVLASANAGPKLTISTIGGDNVVNSAEAATLVISGTVASGTTSVKLRIGTSQVSAALAGTEWSYALQPADLASLGADGSKSITAQATLSDGTSATASRTITLAAQAPASPVTSVVATDDAINSAEQVAGVTVRGTAVPGVTVSLTWGTQTRSVRASSTGLWSIDFTSPEIPADSANAPIVVRATDSFGNSSPVAQRPVLIDTVAPVAPGISVVAGDDLVGPTEVSGGVVVSGTGEPGGSVRITLASNTRTTVVDSVGAWTTRFTTAQVPADGEYLLSAVQLDRAGNFSTEATRTVTVDVQPPTPPTISPVAADNIVNAAEKLAGVTIRGTAEANTSIEVSWGATTRTSTTNAAGAWSASFSAAQVPPDGTTRVTATARDGSGNTSLSVERSVLVDTVSGSVTILPIATDGIVNAAEKAQGVIIAGTAEAGSSVSITMNGITRRAAADNSGNWTTSFDTAAVPADGAAEVSARSTDPAGNVSPTVLRRFVIDTILPVAPSINIVSGDDRVGNVERDAGVVVTGMAEANSQVLVRWGSASQTSTTDADGNWVANFSTNGVPTDGATVVTVTATDAAGNTGPETKRSVLVDTFILQPVIETVAGNNVINAAEKTAGVDITGTTEAGAEVAVTFGTVTRRVTADASGRYSASFSSSDIPASGNSTIIARATDLSGNISAARSLPVVIDTEVNSPSIDPVTADNVVNAAEKLAGVTVSGTAEAGGSVRLSWGAATRIVTVDASGNWSAAFGPADMPEDGTNAISAVLTDVAGNISNAITRDVRIDTGFPVAPVIALVAGDDAINAAERATGVQISGAAEPGALITVNWGAVTHTATADAAGAWTASFTPNEVPGNGLSTVTATQRDTAGNTGPAGSRSVKIDTGQPLPPVINQIAGDDIINLAERNAGITVTGTAQVGATVRVLLAGVERSFVVGNDGSWTVSFASGEIPADGARSITATQTDTIGNVSPAESRPVLIDTAPPLSPTIDLVASNDVVNAAEKAASVAVTGTATAGTLVTVTWGTTVKTITASGAGTWALSFGATEIPADGNTVIVATATDAAGNPSSPFTRPVQIDSITGAAPLIAVVAIDDVVNATEAGTGVAVSGTAEAGASVRLNWSGAVRTVTAAANGQWSAFFDSANVPSDGSTVITAVQTDLAGNASLEGVRGVVVSRAPPAAPVINQLTSDDVVNAAEKSAGVAVSGTGVANASIEVRLGNTTNIVTVDGSGAWATGFTEGNIPADGAAQVTARQTNTIGNTSAFATRSLTVDTQAPPPPVIANVTSDNQINSAEKNAGVTISGTAIAGSQVAVHWGEKTQTVVAGGDGNWNLTFGSADVPADGTTTVSATATDPAGNSSGASTRSVLINTGTPLAPVIATVAGDDVVNATESSASVTVSGTAQAGASVRVDWSGVIRTVTANGSGAWSAVYASTDVPADGSTVISARQTDLTANVSPDGSRAVIVNRALPTAPTIAQVTSDDIINLAEKTAGVAVSGTGVANALIEVKLGNTTKTVTADGSGAWTASFATGEIPVDGAAQVTARQTNAIGNTSAFATRSLTVDTQAPPPPVIASVTSDDQINNAEKNAGVTILGTAIAGSQIAVTWGQVTKTAAAGGDGNWNIAFGSAEVPADGTTTVSATATDTAGNSSAASTRSVLINTGTPSAPVIATVAGDDVVNATEAGASVTVSGTAQAGASVRVDWSGVIRTVTANGSGAWSAVYASTEVPADGSTVISARQTDLTANVSPDGSRAVIVNRALPAAPTIAQVTSDDIINLAEKTAGVAVSGTGVANASIEVKLGNTTKTVTAGDNGAWTTSFATGEIPVDGAAQVTARQTNAIGNMSAFATRSLTVDTQAPVVPSINLVAGDDRVSLAEKNASVSVSGTAEANTQVAVTWGGTTQTATAAGNGSWIVSFGSLEIPADGSTEITARSTDIAGNVSAATSRPVLVDTAAPGAPVINAVATDNFITATEALAAIVVSGTGEIGATVNVNWSGISRTTTVQANATWSVSYAAGTIPADGSTFISVTQTDPTGNIGTAASRNVIIDTVTPGVPVITAMSNDYGTAGDFITDRNSTTVLGTGEAGAKLEVFVGGTSIGVVDVDSAGFWTSPQINLAALAMGSTQSITVRQTDAAGNIGATSAATTITKQFIGSSTSSTIDLAIPTFTQGVRIIGSSIGDQFGGSVALAGDVNNDGRADIVMGGGFYNNGVSTGLTAVVFGKDTMVAGSTVDLRVLAPTDGFGVRGENLNDGMGFAASGLGDINGDGIADVVTSAPAADPNGLTDPGVAYIVFGKPTGSIWGSTANSAGNTRSDIIPSSLAPSEGFVFRGLGAGDRVGAAVAGPGDLNGDGIADIVISGTFVDRFVGSGQTAANNVGEVYLIFGKASGTYGSYNSSTGRNEMTGLDVTAANGIVLRGGSDSDTAGFSVASAGDVNGDGVNDLIIGATLVDNGTFISSGAAYVLYGKKPGDSWTTTADPLVAGRQILDLSLLRPTDGFMIQGENNSNAQVGVSVDSAGDVNGDGFADLVVGGSAWNNGAVTNVGTAFVVFGSATGSGPIVADRQVLQLSSMTSAQGFIIRGIALSDNAGRAVSRAGDINGDSVDDLVVGVALADRGAVVDTGNAYVIYGKKAGGDGWGQSIAGQSVLSLANFGAGDGLFIQGSNNPATDKRTGQSLAGLGDFNRDGIADIAIGVQLGDGARGANSGEVDILFGSTAFAGGLTLSGSTGANTLAGSSLADTMSGLGGADVIFGFAGDDIFVVPDLSFARIDGGTGSDTICLSAAGINFNLDSFSSGALTSIERIDLVNGGANALTVRAANILAMSSDARLIVDREAADTITALGFAATGAYGTIGTKVYDVLTSGGATLWIQRANAGTEGLDTLTAAAGASVTYGFGSDDIIIVADSSFRKVDGGTGIDTLRLANDGQMLDLTALAAGTLAGIEKIDLANGGANTLVLSEATVINLSATTNRLIVDRDAGDTVTMPGFTLSGLAQAFGTNVYDTYTSGAAQVLLQRTDAQIGTDGANMLTAVAGATLTFGLAGDDVITVSDTAFARIDGGVGFDTLKVGTTDQSLNLDTVGAGVLTGIERIDLTGAGTNSLTVSAATLIALSTTSDILIVDRDAADTVDLTGWTLGTAQGFGTTAYTVYTSGLAQLWVQRFDDQLGTAGADTVALSATAGAALFSFAGDDVITASNLLFGRIDGGEGNDTLDLSAAATTIDLGALPAGTIGSIETINLTGGSSNTLTITPAAAASLSGSTDRIFVSKSSDDTVITTGFTAVIQPVSVGLVVYDSFSTTSSFGTVELYVQRSSAVVGDNNANNLTATAGATSVTFGFAGNDVITVSDNLFLRVEGGGNVDTLKYTAAGALNTTVAGFANGRVTNIEVIDINNGLANTMTVNAASIIAMSGEFTQSLYVTDSLYVNLDANDTLTATGFIRGITLTNALGTYRIFTSGTATLYVTEGVGTVVI